MDSLKEMFVSMGKFNCSLFLKVDMAVSIGLGNGMMFHMQQAITWRPSS